mmetsp:Transcript_24941/g.50623  ORF Transcript_24941/g.50623 Transcript_24941/m.50623 type:complete len:250 (+) Transcript_24941:199-948(+)
MRPERPAIALSGFPTLRVTFGGGGRMLWRPQSYLYRKDGTGNVWCYGFQDNGPIQETVLGATWMLHRDIIFDINRRRLGLAEAHCPDFKKRPPAPSGRSMFFFAGMTEPLAMPVTDGRPRLFAAILLLVVGGGLWVLVMNMRLASQRAARDLEAEKSPARRPRLATLQGKRGLALSPNAASPTFIGRSSSDRGEEGVELNEGVCSTPIEVWMRPRPGSDSGGGTPGSVGGEDSRSSSDARAQDTSRLIS